MPTAWTSSASTRRALAALDGDSVDVVVDHGGSGPLGRGALGDAVAVLDDDPRFAVDPPADLEPARGAVAGGDRALWEVDRLRGGPLLPDGVDPFQLDADGVGDHRDGVAPGEDEDLGDLE